MILRNDMNDDARMILRNDLIDDGRMILCNDMNDDARMISCNHLFHVHKSIDKMIILTSFLRMQESGSGLKERYRFEWSVGFKTHYCYK